MAPGIVSLRVTIPLIEPAFTGGVTVYVGVDVGNHPDPDDVGVGVGVNGVPVDVGIGVDDGVAVDVDVGVGVDVNGVPVDVGNHPDPDDVDVGVGDDDGVGVGPCANTSIVAKSTNIEITANLKK